MTDKQNVQLKRRVFNRKGFVFETCGNTTNDSAFFINIIKRFSVHELLYLIYDFNLTRVILKHKATKL